MKTVNDITNSEIEHFYVCHFNSRPAKSKKYFLGERVTPSDTPRKGDNEYFFVSSIRWEPHARGCNSYGGYMLLNPRTGKLISCTNIISLDHPEKNERC